MTTITLPPTPTATRPRRKALSLAALGAVIEAGGNVRRGTIWPRNRAFPEWQWQVFSAGGEFAGHITDRVYRQYTNEHGFGCFSRAKGLNL
jgi:hypothetical protein